MCVVVGVGPVNLGDKPTVAFDGNTGIRKELPDGGGNPCGSVGGAAALPDYHAFPLIEEVVALHDVVDPASVSASMRSMTENGNRTFVSMNTLATNGRRK